MDSQPFCTPCTHTIKAALTIRNKDLEDHDDNNRLGRGERSHDKLTKSGFEPGGWRNRNQRFAHKLQRYFPETGDIHDIEELCASDDVWRYLEDPFS